MNWDTISLTDVVRIGREISDAHHNSYSNHASAGGYAHCHYVVTWAEAQARTFKRWGITCPRLKAFLCVVAYTGELTEIR